MKEAHYTVQWFILALFRVYCCSFLVHSFSLNARILQHGNHFVFSPKVIRWWKKNRGCFGAELQPAAALWKFILFQFSEFIFIRIVTIKCLRFPGLLLTFSKEK